MTDITTIVYALILLFSAIITALLIPYIRSRTTSTQLDKFLTWVKIGVSAAEQLYKAAKSGAEKKKYVKEFLENKGYTYDEDTINAALEAAVQQLYKPPDTIN